MEVTASNITGKLVTSLVWGFYFLKDFAKQATEIEKRCFFFALGSYFHVHFIQFMKLGHTCIFDFIL
jgi:hypothetical protein